MGTGTFAVVFGLSPSLPLDRDDVVHCPVLGGDLACGNNRCIAEVRELDGRHHAKFTGVRDYEALGRMAHRDTLYLRLLDIGRVKPCSAAMPLEPQKPQLKL